MSVLTEDTTTIAEHIKLRRPRNQKSTISSLLLSTFSPNTNEPTNSSAKAKKKGTNFASFKGLGCTAAEKVAVPEAVIRNSADWKNKSKSNSKSKKKQKSNSNVQNDEASNSKKSVDASGCGNLAVDDAAPVECVMPRRSMGGRMKIDVENISHRERPSCSVRRTVNPESLAFLDSDTAFVTTYTEQEIFGTKYYRHTRHPSPDSFTEIMMLQGGLMRRDRFDMPDRFSAWRLDVDNMSYEELLALGERIGYVNTGLKEDEISRCLRKFRLSTLFDLLAHLPMQLDHKCSICQEEYEADDEIGKLNCGHGYHFHCIKQWLAHKNACPVCKTAPVAR